MTTPTSLPLHLSEGLDQPRPQDFSLFFKGKALGTRLGLDLLVEMTLHQQN